LGNGSSNGIDTTHFSKTKDVLENGSKIKDEYKLSDDDFIFIFIGRIVRDKGINVKHGNGLKRNIYQELKISPENYVVIETGNDKKNLKISRMLKKEYQHKKIISRISQFSLEQKYKQLGVETIDVTQILASAIENLIFRPSAYQAFVESFENFSVEEIFITNPNMEGLQIKEIPFHRDAILMMIKRGNNFSIPHGESYLGTGDILLVFGTQTAFEDTRHKVE